MLPTTVKKLAPTLVAFIATSFCLNAQADDLDVYRALIAAEKKPNILFVLDYSGSMAEDVDGRYHQPIQKRKITILKKAMNRLLDDNVNSINAGLGSLYDTNPSGIKWPISELSSDANSVDPNIPRGKFTVADILKKQINSRGPDNSTATLDALVEASQYFRGGEVTHNDAARLGTWRNRPPVWNANNNNYDPGYAIVGVPATSIPSSYSPRDAYSTDSAGPFYCNNYSASDGPNYCEGKTLLACDNRSANDSPTPGFEMLNNVWGNYTRCQYRRSTRPGNASWVGARYNSPVYQTCQTNAIVLISDGEPTAYRNGDTLKQAAGTDINGCLDLSESIFKKEPRKIPAGNCAVEVLRRLANNDIHENIKGSTVRTYTIGFDLDDEDDPDKVAGKRYLKKLAEAGNGDFFTADSPQELSLALSKTIEKVVGGSENFVQLSIDVDTGSFSHDNRVYYSLFRPSTKRAWSGNLKGYFIGEDGLEDINGDKATDGTQFGEQFAPEAQSFWSASPDGNEVLEGGASARLTANPDRERKLYTFTDDDDIDDIPARGINLKGSDEYRLHVSNDEITEELMELDDDDDRHTRLRNQSLKWIQTAPMGDPLHTKSVRVDYGDKQVVFIATNQGLLHAIDATKPDAIGEGDTSGGDEIYAFMPRRLIKNLPRLMVNSNGRGHIYGLDGGITRWHTDVNENGIVDNDEQVLLIFGMRRGGTAYYALNISKWNSPKLQWIIDDTNSDFPALAQSWSRMSLITVNDNGTKKKVLAFTAGYDAAVQDGVTSPTPSKGNAIYMINQRGERVWKVDATNHPEMKYSIPSDLSVIDTDGDHITDRIYVGDTGGQVWRIDVHDINTTPKVTRMAALNDSSHQPFFYPPNVAFNSGDYGRYLSIAIGSGNRTNPLLSPVQNHIYVLRDTDVDKSVAAADFDLITPDELYDVTNNDIGSLDGDVVKQAQKKLKARVESFEGRLLATTFRPNYTTQTNACTFQSVGRYYSMNLEDATPSREYDASEPRNGADNRYTKLNNSAIPSAPAVIAAKGTDSGQVVVDKETVDEFDLDIKRVFWHGR